MSYIHHPTSSSFSTNTKLGNNANIADYKTNVDFSLYCDKLDKKFEKHRHDLKIQLSQQELQLCEDSKSDEYKLFKKELHWLHKKLPDSKIPDKYKKHAFTPFQLAPFQRRNAFVMYNTMSKNVGGHGSILADEMGFGKTLTLITLIFWILSHPLRKYPIPRANKPRILVVSLFNVLDGPWRRHLMEYYGSTEEYNKKVHWWYGSQVKNKIVGASEWDDIEIVKTTLGTVLSQHQKWKENPGDEYNLFNQSFESMVCDEGAELKNGKLREHKTYNAMESLDQGCCLLSTGTVIHNNIMELCSLACLVGPKEVWGNVEYWNRIKNNSIAIRQACTNFIVKTPKKDAEEQRKKFNASLKEQPLCTKYTVLCKMSQMQLEKVQQIVQNSLNELDLTKFKKDHIWPVMIRCMQACTTPYFISDASQAKNMNLDEEEEVKMDIENHKNDELKHKRKIEDSDEDNSSSISTKKQKVKHNYVPTHHIKRKNRVIETNNNKNQKTKSNSDKEKLRQEKLQKELGDTSVEDLIKNSCKIPPLLDIIQGKVIGEKRKIVIYCSRKIVISMYMKVIEEKLGLKCIRYDSEAGDVTTRKKNLQQFKKDNSYNILFANSKSSGLGIDLTCASVMCIIEPEWNNQRELQMEKRIDRPEQSRETEIYKFHADGLTMDGVRLYNKCVKEKYISNILEDGREEVNSDEKDSDTKKKKPNNYVFFTKKHFTVDQQKAYVVQSSHLQETYEASCIIKTPFQILRQDELPEFDLPPLEKWASQEDKQKTQFLMDMNKNKKTIAKNMKRKMKLTDLCGENNSTSNRKLKSGKGRSLTTSDVIDEINDSDFDRTKVDPCDVFTSKEVPRYPMDIFESDKIYNDSQLRFKVPISRLCVSSHF